MANDGVVVKIRSGGQTGADRGALDFAIESHIPYEGWVPKDGWAEDQSNPPGIIATYPKLRETESADPAVRTRFNVLDADLTIVLTMNSNRSSSPGTDLTVQLAKNLGKPYIVIDLADESAATKLGEFLRGRATPVVVNIAGPRESEVPGIQHATLAFLRKCRDDGDVRILDPSSA